MNGKFYVNTLQLFPRKVITWQSTFFDDLDINDALVSELDAELLTAEGDIAHLIRTLKDPIGFTINYYAVEIQLDGILFDFLTDEAKESIDEFLHDLITDSEWFNEAMQLKFFIDNDQEVWADNYSMKEAIVMTVIALDTTGLESDKNGVRDILGDSAELDEYFADESID